MSVLKYYNTNTSTWDPASLGNQGATGATGYTGATGSGATGATGPVGATGSAASSALIKISSGSITSATTTVTTGISATYKFYTLRFLNVYDNTNQYSFYLYLNFYDGGSVDNNNAYGVNLSSVATNGVNTLQYSTYSSITLNYTTPFGQFYYSAGTIDINFSYDSTNNTILGTSSCIANYSYYVFGGFSYQASRGNGGTVTGFSLSSYTSAVGSVGPNTGTWVLYGYN